MVLVARAATLIDLFDQHQPVLRELFRVYRALPRMTRDRFLADRYPLIPAVDFSHDVLTPAARRTTLFTWPASMGWSDLGTPERLSGWLSSDVVTGLAS